MDVAFVVLTVIIAVEAVVIVIGNLFAIFVFWTQRFRLKQACFALINLAVADLLAGIVEAIGLVTQKIPFIGQTFKAPPLISWGLDVFALFTSLFFLALISLERAYAVLWPLRHRATSTRVYIYSIVIVWVAGLCVAGVRLLANYHPDFDNKYATGTLAASIFVSLFVICASYSKIHSRLQSRALELDNHRRQSMEQNLRMSKTLFIVVGVSLLLWLPSFVVLAIANACSCFPSSLASFVFVTHFANCMVNPFVYSYRMPVFKASLTKFRGRIGGENVEMRSIRRKSQDPECKL